MKIAVLGSGNGGTAVAADWSLAGHDVYMFDFEGFQQNIEAINKNGGIYTEGDLNGFANIRYAGTDIEHVLDGADLVFVVGPAYGTKAFGEACKDYIKENQIVIVCPSSCAGSIVFKNALNESIRDKIIVGETSTLPYACRLIEPGKVKVFLKLKAGLFIAASPASHIDKVFDIFKTVYPSSLPAKNILQTTLQNGNPVIHPAVTILNAGLIERTKGDFYFYEDGVTSSVGRLIEAVDRERLSLADKLGIDILSEPDLGCIQGYMNSNNYSEGYSTAPGFKGIKAQQSLDDRYLTEDVGYGLVFMSELGKHIGVETPVMDSVITIASVLLQRDFRAEKIRTMESLGLDRYSIEELLVVL
ncbi:NAD/NADP octopine/nopaline dehydrogenase family protein [Sutcliffiella cohnii]